MDMQAASVAEERKNSKVASDGLFAVVVSQKLRFFDVGTGDIKRWRGLFSAFTVFLSSLTAASSAPFFLDSGVKQLPPKKEGLVLLFSLRQAGEGAGDTSISPVKSILSFTKNMIAWTDVSNHDSITSSTKGILEQLSELGISIWDVLFSLHQCIDAAAEC
nr:hypothetical protein Itr_chr09CG10570 [Ipomoea trifida]